MAFGGRRSMLSTYDNNIALPANNPPMSGMKPSKGVSRPSMIPRQSVAPPRVPSTSVVESMLSVPGRNSVGPRSSMAVGAAAGYGGLSSSTMADGDVAGPSTMSTPHRGQMLNARRGESAGRMSVAPTPNTRRSIGGRQSLAPRPGGNPKTTQTDPRPIREDRQMLAKMEADIQDFLSDTGFVFPAKYSGEFHMPSQVLVMSAFRHLYHQCIDLKYIFNAEPKKEVEEVMQLLGDIKYPFLSDLSKTKLSAPGSIHNWPPVVGLLHWMLYVKISLDIPTSLYHGGPLERPPSEEDDDYCHYFPYLWRCYEEFWDSKDEYPEEREQLEGIFYHKSQQAREECQRLERDEANLLAELAQLEENESPIRSEETERKVLESDIAKFVEYKETVLLPRINHYEATLDVLKKEIGIVEEKMQASERERKELQDRVDAQNVSEDDFERMSRQREELAEKLKLAMAKLQEQSSVNNHAEVSLSNKQLGVEEELEKLSDKCRGLGMFPYVLPNGNEISDLYIIAGNTTTMLADGLDLGQGFKREILRKRERLSASYKDVTTAKIKDQEEYDVIMEEVEEKREELIRLDTRLKSVKDQSEVANNISKEESRLQAEAEANHELALVQIEQASRHALDQAESRLQSATMQITTVRDHNERMREELHHEFVAGLETILSLKSLVTEGLKSLEEATKVHSKQE